MIVSDAPVTPDKTSLIPVGISECLLGRPVRYDGGHKRSAFCVDELGRYFDFTPVCPEMAIGMPAPREAIQLRRGENGTVRLLGTRSNTDHTDAMTAFANNRSTALSHLCGYIVTKRSPSCAMERIKVYRDNGMPDSTSHAGLYTHIFRNNNPLIPVEEDGRLNDPQLRENFVLRVFVLARWRVLMQQGLTAKALVDFHSDHKYLLMAHNVSAYRELGRVIAALHRDELSAIATQYIHNLMLSLRKPATRRGHANVLMHMQGYFKKVLPAGHKSRLLAVITDYRKDLLPLSAPLTLLQHFLADFPDAYLQRQVYLQPYPDDLKLRNFL